MNRRKLLDYVFAYFEIWLTVKCLSVSIEEDYLAAGCVDGSIRLFNLTDHEIIATLPNEHPRPSG